jgi:predicted PurR-regulated permease PerM
MLGLDLRSAKAAWTVFLVVLGVVVIYHIRTVILVFILSILFAYLLSPVVNVVDRFALRKRASRNYSLAAVYVALVGALVLLGFVVGAQINQEAVRFAAGFPDLVRNLEQRLAEPGPGYLEPVRAYLLDTARERLQSFTTLIGPLLQKVTGHVISFLSGAIIVVLIPILAFFFLKDGRELKAQMLLAVDPARRAVWEDIFSDVHQLLGEFIRALVLLSFATLAAYGLFFLAIGMPYGVLLASNAAVLEFIPVIGPFAAAVMIVMVAAVTGFGHLILILAFLAAYRIFQDYILLPHLMSAGVALHPLLVILGALAGGEIAGIPGMFLSVPILATLRVFYVRMRKARAAAAAHAIAP